MARIRFAQISDTHLPGTPANAFLTRICQELRDPWDNLRDCLKELADAQVDFVVHTGDVVHEGCAADYRRMRDLFAEYLPGVPVIVAVGNHDRRPDIAEALPELVRLTTGELVQEVWLACGLRVLAVDTIRQEVTATLSGEQLDWLESCLEEPAERGTLLLMHHPVIWEAPIYALPVTERLVRLVMESDVCAVLAGHTHQNLAGTWAGKPFYVADSLGIGMKHKAGQIEYHARTGYTLFDLEDSGALFAENRLVCPKSQILEK